MPKKAEYRFFFSKFPGIGYDLSILNCYIKIITDLDNLMGGSVDYKISFDISCFEIGLNDEFIIVDV